MKRFLVFVLFAVNAFSYSYTAFPILTPEKCIAVNPFIYGNGSGFVGTDVFLSYGMTGKSDIWIQLSAYNTGCSDFSGMIRYDIGNSKIIAMRANGAWMAPQFHFFWENDKIALQANLASQFSYEYMDKPAIYAIISPVTKFLNGKIDVFTEINPGYYMQDGDFANLWIRPEGFGLDVVGGVGFKIGECLFSAACPIYDALNDATPTFGLWFCYAK